ncbi:MAG: hypothetical protein ACD_62C00326G0004 [uncultured bacterium]|nr:MAG: hypothetical protein ACD_62C00326G0004 [uncultured bacterium]HLD45543.1 PIN domain-containing protein [bacterium]
MRNLEKIYLDTSVFSAFYDSKTPQRQEQTVQFWNKLSQYQNFISTIVIDEINAVSDVALKQKLLALTQNHFQILAVTQDSEYLAKQYVQEGIFPLKYFDDALHLATASINQIDIVLSWNFAHFVKRKTRILANLVNNKAGYRSVEIIAPPEL